MHSAAETPAGVRDPPGTAGNLSSSFDRVTNSNRVGMKNVGREPKCWQSVEAGRVSGLGKWNWSSCFGEASCTTNVVL